jgi:hypothetical protein
LRERSTVEIAIHLRVARRLRWSGSCKKIIHPRGCILTKARDNVTVCVQGQANLGVAEDLHDYPCGNSLNEKHPIEHLIDYRHATEYMRRSVFGW